MAMRISFFIENSSNVRQAQNLRIGHQKMVNGAITHKFHVTLILEDVP